MAPPGVGGQRASGMISPARRGARWLLAGLLSALVLDAGVTTAASPASKDAPGATASEVAGRQNELNALRAQIEKLRRTLLSAEQSHRNSADDLQDVDRTISQTQRGLHELSSRINELKRELKEHDERSRELERRLKGQQGQLEKLLHRQYQRGNPDPLRLLLNGDDPNQLARDLFYLEAIGRARSQLLVAMAATLHDKQALASATRQQTDELSLALSRQQEAHDRLLAQREQRRIVLSRIADQLAAQRQELGNLQRDEKRMSELIDRLSKIIAAQAAEEMAARQAAARRQAAEAATRRQAAAALTGKRRLATESTASRPAADAATSRPPAEAAANRQAADAAPPRDPAAPTAERGTPEESAAEQAPAPQKARESATEVAVPATGGGLTRLKGGLRAPASGVVINRFGASRQEGSTWKGVFIRAGSGSEVRSIAAGRVVFAEWMRGFGNLLIVDHGSTYLSVYANNDALLKQVGDNVRPGEAIATVGNSGGNPESGLYFELRHQGKPLDPLSWVNLK